MILSYCSDTTGEADDVSDVGRWWGGDTVVLEEDDGEKKD